MNRTPEEAKKLVTGPLDRQMEMFPLRFCEPAYFGVPPSREHPGAVNSGTVSLLDLRGDLLAVTCHHVIQGYRRKLANCLPLSFMARRDGIPWDKSQKEQDTSPFCGTSSRRSPPTASMREVKVVAAARPSNRAGR
jgi:hypothetical protein